MDSCQWQLQTSSCLPWGFHRAGISRKPDTRLYSPANTLFLSNTHIHTCSQSTRLESRDGVCGNLPPLQPIKPPNEEWWEGLEHAFSQSVIREKFFRVVDEPARTPHVQGQQGVPTQTLKHTLTLQSSPVPNARPVTQSARGNPRPGAISSSSLTRSASQGPEPCSGSGEHCSPETTGSPWSLRSAWSSRTPREAETCPEDRKRVTRHGREREKGPEHPQCVSSGEIYLTFRYIFKGYSLAHYSATLIQHAH